MDLESDKSWPLRRPLTYAWLALTLAGLYVELWKYAWEGGRTAWVRFLGLSYEQNLPTWYASSLLLMCALVLALVARSTHAAGDRFVWHWSLLSFGFAYISLDETATIHEHWSDWFHFDGIFHFGWVIPAGVIVVVLLATYLPFLRGLPSRVRRRFVAAGMLYVGGAVIVELALGYWTDQAGKHNLTYGLIDLVEESMELLGISVFLSALVEHSRLAARLERWLAEDRNGDPVVEREGRALLNENATPCPETSRPL